MMKSEQMNVLKQNFKQGSTLHLIYCSVGIFISYFVYGILQETITRGVYGEDKEKFKYTISLVLFQCMINALFVKAALFTMYRSKKDVIPWYFYMLCSMSYIGAMFSSNYALKYVAYPTQVLGKSVKPIPIMILGVLLAQKRYSVIKYICILTIVVGVCLFLYKDKKLTEKIDSRTVFGVGELWLLISLTFDGITGAIQDKLRANWKVDGYHLMFGLNSFSIIWLSVAFLVTGEISDFFLFAQKYPYVLVNMLLFSLTSALGQHFVFTTIAVYGPLTCSVVTTTRKFFTILSSVLLFSNPMTNRQWLGTVLVFIGLSVDSRYGKEVKTRLHDRKESTKSVDNDVS